jgi:uncharacterized protein
VGPLSNYLDASILVALLTVKPFSGRADTFVRTYPDGLIVSDFAAAEFASAIARRVRMREATIEEARSDLSDFDSWVMRSAQQVHIVTADIAIATMCLRRLDFPLRTPDALHVAIARRLDSTLVTFDRQMAVAARTLGAAVAMP